MVRGIATDNKKYKHIKRDNTKWLSKDLNVFKKYIEKYIDSIRPDDEKKTDTSPGESKKKMMTFDRIIAVLFLGLFGSISLIAGIFLLIKEVYIIGVPAGLFGAVLVICFFLFEKYR